MKVDTGKSDEGTRGKKNVMNGESSHSSKDDSSKDSQKRSRSRSKSPRNTIMNGDLMFDAALYAPERPKRNRKKPEEEIFTPVKEPLLKSKKRKAPEKPTKKKPEAKSTKTPAAKKKNEKADKEKREEEEDEGPPKAKRKCTTKAKKKSTSASKNDDTDSDYEPEENPAKTPKSSKTVKPTPKGKTKATPKNAAVKDASKGAKSPSKAPKKVPDKKAKSVNPEENSEDEEPKQTSSTKATPSKAPNKAVKTPTKAKKNTNAKDNAKPSTTNSKTDQTPKVKERASKPKKSPAKIEIDGIEITELSDLNSSKEDDFNSSRDSINNVCGENDTSTETVIYDKPDSGAKTDNHVNDTKSPDNVVAKRDNQTEVSEDSKEETIAISKQYSSDAHAARLMDTNIPVSSMSISSSIPSTSHLLRSPLAATSSSHVSPLVKGEGSSPSNADPAPLMTPSSLHPNHTSTPFTPNHHPVLTSTPKPMVSQPEGEKKLPCPQPGCKYVGKSGVLLRKHLRNHGVFECAHCDFTGNQFDLLQNHMKEKHPTRWGRKKCKKCCRHIRLDMHEEHETACDGTKIWNCEDCNQEFPYESTLKEHRKKHKKQARFECEFCEFKCELKTQLKTHVDSNHAELKTTEHPCTKCKRTFYTQTSLDTHLQLHDADSGRTFPCSICNKTFKSEQSVVNHEATVHQNHEDVKCGFEGCGEMFKTQRLLTEHRKEVHKIGGPSKVSKVTMYKCEQEGCGLEFPRLNHLKKHMGIHTGKFLPQIFAALLKREKNTVECFIPCDTL